MRHITTIFIHSIMNHIILCYIINVIIVTIIYYYRKIIIWKLLEDIKKIFSAIESELKISKQKFQAKTESKKFKL